MRKRRISSRAYTGTPSQEELPSPDSLESSVIERKLIIIKKGSSMGSSLLPLSAYSSRLQAFSTAMVKLTTLPVSAWA